MRKKVFFKTNEKETPKSKCNGKYPKLFKEIQYLLFNRTKGDILRKYFLNSPFIYITSIREQ